MLTASYLKVMYALYTTYHVTLAISVYQHEACCSVTARLAQIFPQLTIDAHKAFSCIYTKVLVYLPLCHCTH